MVTCMISLYILTHTTPHGVLLTLQTQEEDGGALVAIRFGWGLGVALVTETYKVC